MRNFTSSGVALNNTDMIRLLTQTVFPAPVVPAIKRCGISPRSATIGWPEMSLPIASINFDFDFWKLLPCKTSLRKTAAVELFGTSMPTLFLPGMGATMRTAAARIAKAISSDNVVILCIFTPGAGSSSYRVITGPRSISATRALTLKSFKVFSRVLAPSSKSLCSRVVEICGGEDNKSRLGTVYSPTTLGRDEAPVSSGSLLLVMCIRGLLGAVDAVKDSGESSPSSSYSSSPGSFSAGDFREGPFLDFSL